MFKERTTEKLIEYLQTLPDKEQKFIVKSLSTSKVKKPRKIDSARTEQDILDTIKGGLQEIKEAKRTGKSLKNLGDTLHELKNKR